MLGSHISDWINFLPGFLVKLDYILIIILAIDIAIYLQNPVIRHLIEPLVLGTYVFSVILPRRLLGLNTLGFFWERFKWSDQNHILPLQEFNYIDPDIYEFEE